MIAARIRNAERDALTRDLDDIARLRELQEMIVRWATELAPLAYPLEHPYRRWSPEELAEALLDAQQEIQGEIFRIARGGVVIEDIANEN